MQWGGRYFVYNTLPFGWKISPLYYHSTGLVVTNFFRSMGIPCSLYINDRKNSQLQIPPNQGPYANLENLDEHNLAAAKSAIFMVAYFLIKREYFLGCPNSSRCLVRLSHIWVSCPTPLETYSILFLKRRRSFLILLNKPWHVPESQSKASSVWRANVCHFHWWFRERYCLPERWIMLFPRIYAHPNLSRYMRHWGRKSHIGFFCVHGTTHSPGEMNVISAYP